MYLNICLVTETPDVIAAVRDDENLFLHYYIPEN